MRLINPACSFEVKNCISLSRVLIEKATGLQPVEFLAFDKT
jgi:hypothetical protein